MGINKYLLCWHSDLLLSSANLTTHWVCPQVLQEAPQRALDLFFFLLATLNRKTWEALLAFVWGMNLALAKRCLEVWSLLFIQNCIWQWRLTLIYLPGGMLPLFSRKVPLQGAWKYLLFTVHRIASLRHVKVLSNNSQVFGNSQTWTAYWIIFMCSICETQRWRQSLT